MNCRASKVETLELHSIHIPKTAEEELPCIRKYNSNTTRTASPSVHAKMEYFASCAVAFGDGAFSYQAAFATYSSAEGAVFILSGCFSRQDLLRPV